MTTGQVGRSYSYQSGASSHLVSSGTPGDENIQVYPAVTCQVVSASTLTTWINYGGLVAGGALVCPATLSACRLSGFTRRSLEYFSRLALHSFGGAVTPLLFSGLHLNLPYFAGGDCRLRVSVTISE